MNKGLNTAQLLFEPRPPTSHSLTSQSPTIRRRVQSAKEQKRVPSRIEDVKGGRPRSAACISDKKKEGRVLSRPPSAKDGRLPPRKFLSFETDNSKQDLKLSDLKSGRPPSGKCRVSLPAKSQRPPTEKEWRLSLKQPLTIHDACAHVSSDAKKRTSKKQLQSEIVNASLCNRSQNLADLRKNNPNEDLSADPFSSIPTGISALSTHLTFNVSFDRIGVDPASCFVFLPCLASCSLADLPVVPAPQHPSDTLPHQDLPITVSKTFNPKELFHYDVEKNRPSSSEQVCGHKRNATASLIHSIFGQDGKLLYDERKYRANRTAEMIQREIDDLENLLEGIGREESSNPFVQYQHEINQLQNAAKEALIKHKVSPVTEKGKKPDLMSLRAYLKEKERIIKKIKARRETCLEELKQLEPEVGFSIKVEVNNSKTSDDDRGGTRDRRKDDNG